MWNSPWRMALSAPKMVTFFYCLQRIPRLETQVHNVISPTMILTYMMSLTSMSPSRVVPMLCLLQKRASYKSRYVKSLGLSGSTLYGLWSFAPRQVQTCFPWHVNSHRERRSQVTNATTSWSILQPAISSVIAKLRLVNVGLLELIFFMKPTMRGQYLLPSYPREISMTFTLN